MDAPSTVRTGMPTIGEPTSRGARWVDGVGAGPRAGPEPLGAEEGAEDEAWLETALVERAKTDPEAFGALYDRYCRARLGSREAAEDATSQTFAAALAALPRCRQREGGGFRRWLDLDDVGRLCGLGDRNELLAYGEG